MPPSHRVDLPPYSFFETRSGAGTPVVLLHGLGGSSDWWRRNVEALAREHLVCAVDLIGQGRNRFFVRRSRLPKTLEEIAELLGRWIAAAFDGPVHLVGNSMGGHIALHVAARRPELVRSLVLVDATGVPFALAPSAHVRNLIAPAGAFSFAQLLARDLFRTGPASALLSLARLMRDDARPLMAAIRAPVLLVWGEHDPLVPLTYARQMAQAMPQARLVVIPRAGHVPMWDNAAAFNEAVTAFLRQADGKDQQVDERPRAFAWEVSGWTGGVAHREAGRGREVVLVHGLGMSGAYFGRFASALFDRGLDAIAPDLPGFGDSAGAPAAGPDTHAQLLAAWADAQRIRAAVWIGHSAGGNAVAHLARLRPDLVRRLVVVGPLWRRHSALRLLPRLLLDALREPLALWRFVLPAYWRCGPRRWFGTIFRYRRDVRAKAPAGALLLAGARDPLPDRDALAGLAETPGAHAAHFSHPAAVADAVIAAR